jgi:hypothetical protein
MVKGLIGLTIMAIIGWIAGREVRNEDARRARRGWDRRPRPIE